MDRQNFSIGYTSQVTGLPQSVLRYWETVFPQFRPMKTAGGTRRYTQEDIDLVLKIKDLLYDRKFTIAGARTHLSREEPVRVERSEIGLREFIITELEGIIKYLEQRKS